MLFYDPNRQKRFPFLIFFARLGLYDLNRQKSIRSSAVLFIGIHGLIHYYLTTQQHSPILSRVLLLDKKYRSTT